jgi:hypothetical protein
MQASPLTASVSAAQPARCAPGSSISGVHKEAMARYGILTGEVETLTAIAAAAFYHWIDGSSMKEPVVAVNSLSWCRTAWLEIG